MMARNSKAATEGDYFWLVALLLTAGIEIAAIFSAGDSTWDLRNYHIYDPFALLNKAPGVDIAPAHMQTFFPPTLDLLFYGLVRKIPSTPVLNALLALPHALAVVLAGVLGARLARPRSWIEMATLGLFLVVSATGVATTSTLATSMSDMLPASLVLAAILVIVPADLERLPSHARLFAAGLLAGAGCGLKLTMSYMVITIAAATLLIPRRALLEVISRPLLLGLGAAVGALALSGWWWLHQLQLYGNPLFPMFNNVFRSPLVAPTVYVDNSFRPHSLLEALEGPWSWALRLSRATAESRLRDPRFAVALPACALVLIRLGATRPRWRPWPVLFVGGLFIIGFVLWREQFSVYRYLAPLEALSGPMMALAALPIARRLGRERLLLAGSAALLGGMLVITVEPNVNRSPRGTPPLAIELGPLPSDSLVLLLDNEPMAYLAAFADPRIRFVATNDFFMTLDDTNPMQKRVQEAIETHKGPIWGLDCPTEHPDQSEQTLQRYHLVRGACRQVQSNLSPVPIRLCRLQRQTVATGSTPP